MRALAKLIPEQVRDHQACGEALRLPEAQGSNEDGGPEAKDDDERGQYLMEVEEDGCPKGVEEELDREEDEAGLPKSRFRADVEGPPDQPGSDRHEIHREWSRQERRSSWVD